MISSEQYAVLCKRAVDIANHIIITGDTIRKTAKVFNVSKSTVWRDIHVYIKCHNYGLYTLVVPVFEYNTAMRGQRGAAAMHRRLGHKRRQQ
jgi:putative DeoR family transcriptional regulator (stage III sporulation protein D)